MAIKSRSIPMLLSPLAVATALYGCGGGGGGGGGGTPAPVIPAPAPPPDPVTTSITAAGVITGFSSVVVDGTKYEVENDTVVSIEDEDDSIGDDSRLRIGMKVRVEASESDGIRVAERIEYDEDLKGPARDVVPDAANPAIGAFAVVHQGVIVDTNTIFDDDVGDNNGDGSIDIRDLSLPGGGEVVVEVSGLPNPDGFLATRIDRVNSAVGMPGVADDEMEIKGFVDAVADDGSSFSINGATFLVTEDTIFEDGLSADDSLLGLFVEVKADEDTNGDLLAVEVEREDDVGDRNNDGRFDDDDRDGEFEIKGILISVDLSADPDLVVIGGTTLEVADASSLEGLEGSLLELKGSFDDNGVLVLSEVEPEVENTVRTEDRVASVSTEDGTITTRLGLVITPTGSSRVEDDLDESDHGGDHLTPEQFLSRVMMDDYLEARGFPNPDGSVTWTRIEREDDDDQECRLRGPVATISGTDAGDFSFVIEGVTIDVSRISSDGGFQGNDDQPIGRQLFFDELSEGDVVQAKSDDAGLGCETGILTAREVEFEIDDGVVGSVPGDDDDDGNGGGDDNGNDNGNTDELTGTPSEVTDSSFFLDGETITVIGSTLIDDSIIEAALGREVDGEDRRFDQVPDGLSLQDLLPGSFMIHVVVNADGVALSIEDL